jgi:hypothetical protein
MLSLQPNLKISKLSPKVRQKPTQTRPFSKQHDILPENYYFSGDCRKKRGRKHYLHWLKAIKLWGGCERTCGISNSLLHVIAQNKQASKKKKFSRLSQLLL